MQTNRLVHRPRGESSPTVDRTSVPNVAVPSTLESADVFVVEWQLFGESPSPSPRPPGVVSAMAPR